VHSAVISKIAATKYHQISSRVLSPGRHPPSWYEISWYFDAWRSTYKNCTGRQIICRRRPSHLEQSATQHSWLDTVGGNIRNTVKNFPVGLGPRRWCFWTSASEMYITIRYDHMVRIKCTTFDFRWGFAPDPCGSLQRSPKPSSCI